MIKKIFQYLLSISLLSLAGILIMDNFILPAYVGFNNEHYLPDMRGEQIEKAKYELKSLGFKTEVIVAPYDEANTPLTVTKMFPRAFTKVKEGRTIKLTMAGKEENLVIPNLLNMSLRNALLMITRMGMSLDTTIHEYDNDVKSDYVTFQVPREGKTVKSSTKIILGVSKGSPPDYYIVPDLVNLSIDRGKDLIHKSGLRVGKIEYEYQPQLLNNTIIDQSMTPGLRVSFPASINLIITNDRIIEE